MAHVRLVLFLFAGEVLLEMNQSRRLKLSTIAVFKETV